MQIVIELEDSVYEQIKMHGNISEFHELILNGTVLPKGHGRLIDADKVCKAIYAEEDNCTGMGMTFDEMDAYNEGIDAMYSLVRGAKPIIEADKEGK